MTAAIMMVMMKEHAIINALRDLRENLVLLRKSKYRKT